MLQSLLPILLQILPGIVQAVETLFSKKPKSGAAKLNAGTQLALNALALAHVIEPKDVGDAEVALAQDVQTAIVKYENATGHFVHGA